MHRASSRNIGGRLPALRMWTCALTLASVPAAAAAGDLTAIATEIYRIDFESGMDAIAIVTPFAGLTRDPAEVIEGEMSLKLAGPDSAIAIRPEVAPLEPSKIYIVEYKYRALTPGTPLALGVGFNLTNPDGTSRFVSLRGPVASFGAVGVDTRSARAGGAHDTFVFHTWVVGPVIIDDIRILRHDVQSTAPAPPTVALGFPRLSNYQLLDPDTIALINGVDQDQLETVAARYDMLTGPSFDHTLGASAWVQRLKRRNPALRILPYKQAFMAQYDPGVAGTGLLATFNAGLRPDWFMRGPAGELLAEPDFPQNVQLNHTPIGVGGTDVPANTYTANFLAEQVMSSGLWAGIDFDQPEWYINPLLGQPPPAVDLDGNGVAEATGVVQHAWAYGFYDYFVKMKRRLGPGALLLGNTGHIPDNPSVLPMLNGWQGEVISPYRILPNGDWSVDEPSRWYRLLNNYLQATQLARAPQIVSLQFTGRQLGTQTGTPTANGYPQRTPQLEWRDYRRMRLGLTTALLGNGFFEYDFVDNTTPPVWFDEFAVDADGIATTAMAGKGYLGQPLGPAAELPYAQREVFSLDFESSAPR